MDVLDIMRGAVCEGVIECEECGNRIEPDAMKCPCGWINPLRGVGLI